MELEKKDAATIAKEFCEKNDITLETDAPVKDENAVEGKDNKKTDPDRSDDDMEISEDEQKLHDTPDDKLDDDQKAKKLEVINKRNLKTEKRINKLVSKIKELEDRNESYEGKLNELVIEKEALEKKINSTVMPDDDVETVLDKKEADRLNKYLEEDKDKPKEKRREMSKEELEEWIIDDMVAAQRWMLKQEMRRERDRENDEKSLKANPKKHEADVEKENAIALMNFQKKHKDLNVSARRKELSAEGKSDQEIHEILLEENPKYKAVTDIMSDAKLRSQVEAEGVNKLDELLSSRLQTKTSDTEKQDLLKRIEDLEEQLKESSREAVGTGIVSRKSGGRRMETNSKVNAELERTLAMMKSKGINMSAEEYKAMQERRTTIKGAREFHDGIESSGQKI